jgi:glycerol-3-phosphate O-acyltransferase
MEKDLQPSGSHPVVKFERIPIVRGPLSRFEGVRPQILADVTARTLQEFASAPLDLVLGEALYAERLRLKRNRPNVFTKKRAQADKAVWNQVQAGLLHPAAQSDRRALLETVVQHYAGEIGGHFSDRIYQFATHAVPFGFNWLLNAASVKHFMPWGLTESLNSRLQIVGEVPHLQKLAQKGTILMVPTHQSNVDSILIGYLIYLMNLPPFSYGAGLNLFSNPLLSFFMSRLGAYTVDRQKRNEIYLHTLKNYSTRILREGIHSIFFPGGGRSRSGAVEKKLKLGLLGTALDAQIENHRQGKPNPNIYIVPMVTSYHFVLEASSLIEDYLAEAGKHRFIMMDDESWQPAKVASFFWKFFKGQSGVSVRIGRPLDVFGNFVDDEGRSIGPNGTTVDPVRWLTTGGELKAVPQRDFEYTRALGERIVDRFHRENLVLTSHLCAFVYFEALRAKYPDLDLYRFLRLSLAQRSLPYAEFMERAKLQHDRFLAAERAGELHLSDELHTQNIEAWVQDGLRQLGLLHDVAVIKHEGDVVWTEDMNLLYYYRNRLTGYGLSLLAEPGGHTGAMRGAHDAKGFLA